MSRINHRLLRQIVFSLYIAITVLFCSFLIYLGDRENKKSSALAEKERLFMEKLLECRTRMNQLDLVLMRTIGMKDELDETQATALKNEVTMFRIALANFITAGKARISEYPDFPEELGEKAEAINSTVQALVADIHENEPEKKILVGQDIEALISGLDSLRSKIQYLMNVELGNVETWQRQSLFFYKRLQFLLVLFFILTTLFSVAASSLFSHSLNRPLRELSDGTRQISSGNLKYRFNEIQDDEIGNVMHDFNLMVRRLDIQTQALQKANIELQEKAELLIEANSSKDRFLANMSHELRTPLNSIIGFSELIARRAENVHKDEKIVANTSRVLNAAEHLLELISGLLEVAKSDAGVLRPVIKEFDLSACMGNVVSMLNPLAENKNLEIISQVPENIIVSSDERMIRQVFINLLNNAIKFTASGKILMRAEPSDKCITVEFSDTGIGISPEEQKNIFKDFHRVETGLTSNYEGVGLGLTLSKRFVELLGGSIKLSSEPGKGSTFTVILPKDKNKIA